MYIVFMWAIILASQKWEGGMDTKQCHNPACQKPLPTKWGVVDGYRVRTGQTYCGEFCAADVNLFSHAVAMASKPLD